MKLWLIYFESANYWGYGEHCVVQADSEDDAREIAYDHCNDFYYEQDSEQYIEENGSDEDVGSWADIQTCEEFDESHEYWKFYIDPGQSSFYPKLNF